MKNPKTIQKEQRQKIRTAKNKIKHLRKHLDKFPNDKNKEIVEKKINYYLSVL